MQWMDQYLGVGNGLCVNLILILMLMLPMNLWSLWLYFMCKLSWRFRRRALIQIVAIYSFRSCLLSIGTTGSLDGLIRSYVTECARNATCQVSIPDEQPLSCGWHSSELMFARIFRTTCLRASSDSWRCARYYYVARVVAVRRLSKNVKVYSASVLKPLFCLSGWKIHHCIDEPEAAEALRKITFVLGVLGSSRYPNHPRKVGARER